MQNKTVFLQLIAVIFCGLCFSGLSAAADPETPGQEGTAGEKTPRLVDLSSISLEELLKVEISIASKTSESTTQAPSSVTVFTREEIDMLGVSYLEELLNFVPGFQATREIEQGTAIRTSARGRSTALGESVLFLINGQRLNDLYSGGVSIINRYLAIGNIKRVEIIRGPGSALYGANAFVGVVNIITVNDVSDVFVRAGNLGTREGAINLAGGFLNNDLRLSAFVHGFSDEGEKYKNITDVWNITGDTVDPRSGWDAQAKAQYKNLSLYFRHTERKLEDFLSFGILQKPRSNANESTSQSSVTLNSIHQLAEDTKLDFTAGYSQDRWQTAYLTIPLGVETSPGVITTVPLHSGPYLKSYNANAGINFTHQFLDNNTAIAGLLYEATGILKVANLFDQDPRTGAFLGEMREFAETDVTFNEKNTRHIVGVYAQDKHQPLDWLNLVAGVRYDWYNDVGSSVSPRAAAVINTPLDSTVKMIYGHAFRAPSFLELYDKNNPIDFGNPKLKPEEQDTIEAAYIQTLKKDLLQAGLTWYYSWRRELIVLGDPVVDPKNPFGARQFINRGKAHSQGLEFEIKTQPLKKLLATATFTRLIGEDNSYMSNNSGSLALHYQFWKLAATSTLLYHGDVSNSNQDDAYWLWNGNIRYFIVPQCQLRFYIDNILGTSYENASSALPNGVPGRGRTYTFGLSYAL